MKTKTFPFPVSKTIGVGIIAAIAAIAISSTITETLWLQIIILSAMYLIAGFLCGLFLPLKPWKYGLFLFLPVIIIVIIGMTSTWFAAGWEWMMDEFIYVDIPRLLTIIIAATIGGYVGVNYAKKKGRLTAKDISEKSKSNFMGAKWVARILSTITMIFFAVTIIYKIIVYPESRDLLSDISIYITFVIMLIGTIIGWRKEKLGGIILLVGYFGWAIGGYILKESFRLSPTISFILILISGILYIAYWNNKRKGLKEVAEE